MNYIKKKRKTNDICNICGEIKELTWDHVPPKGVLYSPNVITNYVFDKLPTESAHKARYQSGIQYRTICKTCNNVIVGKYDEEYKLFIKEISKELEKINDPSGICSINVKTKINRVLRAISGHILAMKSNYDDQIMTDKFLREYLFDENKLFDYCKIYGWIYSFSTIIISRDFSVCGYHENTHPKGLLSVISSFPLAIVLSSEEENCGMDDLGKYSTVDIDDEVEVTLQFRNMYIYGTNQFKPFNWPLDISNEKTGAMLVLGDGEVMKDSRLGISHFKRLNH